MDPVNDILEKYNDLVGEHVDIIKDEISKKKNIEAILWFKELESMKVSAEREHKTALGPLIGSFARGIGPEENDFRKSKIEIAQLKIFYVKKAIHKSQKLLVAAGLKP